MYTQDTSTNILKSTIKTFPNKEAIIQMKTINLKNTDTVLTYNKEKNSSSKYGITLDTLLLFSFLIGFQDNSKIKTDYFALIAGIMLAL